MRPTYWKVDPVGRVPRTALIRAESAAAGAQVASDVFVETALNILGGIAVPPSTYYNAGTRRIRFARFAAS